MFKPNESGLLRLRSESLIEKHLYLITLPPRSRKDIKTSQGRIYILHHSLLRLQIAGIAVL